ncbi:uncharacterized protein FIESC28_04063 [Fusarium coffeatum]|uniref:Uncharacterized protein n=1 Tax=Fusarium coffeatum TaxID=231269 RepID=A0A366S2K3_9HYPO|nr:uncharacterized protein FIESC28_04063 [Fusarium coffeatum]RBR23068.1 hypothetical protein FIESC28_04063 [Fusarium coffeatum]
MANNSVNKSKPVKSDLAPSGSEAKSSDEQNSAEKKNGIETSTKQGQTYTAPPFSLETLRWPDHPIELPVSMEIVRDPWALERR